MNFGLELQRRRMARRLSKARLGKLANLSGGAIGRMERGERVPREDSLVGLVRALGLTGDERDEFYLAAGQAPPEDSWRRGKHEPLLIWLGALLAHPALDGDARERLLLPAVESAALAAVGYLARQGVPLEDIPPPPAGEELAIEVRDRVMRVIRSLAK